MHAQGRVPGITGPVFAVAEEKTKVIVTEAKHPEFRLVVYLDREVKEGDESYMVDYGEREVECSITWKEDGKIVQHQGRSHIGKDGHIRCDTASCLPFWLEVHQRTSTAA